MSRSAIANAFIDDARRRFDRAAAAREAARKKQEDCPDAS